MYIYHKIFFIKMSSEGLLMLSLIRWKLCILMIVYVRRFGLTCKRDAFELHIIK